MKQIEEEPTTKYSVIRAKDREYQYGVVATNTETNTSIALGWFKTWEDADNSITKFIGRVRTQVL